MKNSLLVRCVRVLGAGIAMFATAVQAAPTKTIPTVVLHDGLNGLALSAPDAAVDADGNIHIAAQGRTSINSSSTAEIYYMLVEPDGTVLIDATLINVADASREGRPSIGLLSTGKAVVMFPSGGAMRYMLIDPSADDQDGDAGVGIIERAEAAIGVDTSSAGISDLVIDSADNAHAFKTNSTSALHVSFNPATGAVVRAEHAIGAANWRRAIRAAIDADDNLHVVYVGSGAAETNLTPLYTMLDINGDTLIPPVQLSPDYEEHGAHLSIMLDGNGRPMIVFGDKRNTLDSGQTWCGWSCETAGTMFFVRLNPNNHPQDGTTEATVDQLRISSELSLGALWYGRAYRAPGGAVHVFAGGGPNGHGGILYRKITPGSPSKAGALKVFGERFDTFNWSKAYPAAAADKLIWTEAIYMPTPDATSLRLVMADMDNFASAKTTAGSGGGSAGGAWTLGALLPLLAAAFGRRRRSLAATVAVLAGLLFPGLASAAPTVLHDGAGTLALSSPRAAVAPNGNIHIVAQGRPTSNLSSSSGTEIYYMYVRPSGTVLIDATQINNVNGSRDGRASIVALDNGKAVVLWNDGAASDALNYALVDPSVDDRDGDAGVGIIEDGPTAIGATGAGYVQGALDSTGLVHVIKDTGTLYHMSFDPATGAVDTASHTIALTGGNATSGRRHPPAFAIDADDNLHLAYGSSTLDGNAPAAYLMLDSAGVVLIDETQLYVGDIFPHARHISLAVDGNGRVHIVYGDKRDTIDANSWCDFCSSSGSSFYVRLDPSRHVQDGSAGDVATLRIGSEASLGDLWYGRAFLHGGKMHFFSGGHQGRGSMMYETITPGSSGATVSSARFFDTQLGGHNFSKHYPTFAAGKVIWAEEYFSAPLTYGSVRIVMANLSAFQGGGGGGGAPAPLMLALFGLAALWRQRMRRGG